MGSSEGQQTFCLKWNHHKTNLVEILEALIKVETYVDCTLVVDDQVTFKAHRVVLAANSPYFQSILADVPMDHCSILFPGVKDFEMRALLEYMYTGEVNVTQAHIPRIMKVAEQLEVKGLFDMTELRRRPGSSERTPAASPPRVVPAAPSSVSPPAQACRWPPPPTAPVLSAAYDSADMNPLKRKKLSSMLATRDTPILRNVLAQVTPVDSSQPMSLVCHPVSQHAPPRLHSNGSAHEPDRPSSPQRPFEYRPRRLSSRASSPHYNRSDRSEDAHSPYTERSFEEENQRTFHPSPPPPNFQQDVRAGLAPYVPPQQKPEWKRYKQYTRSDIMSAIECVRNGMSALQASRKYGVPSRTLYDKVKKLGITTSRPMSRGVKRESNGAAFPYGLSGTGGNDDGSQSTPLIDPSFLQQALEGATRDGGREALHAMALAAAAHAALTPRTPPRSAPESPRTPPPDDDHVEDLSVSRRRDPDPPSGVIVPPRNFALDCGERD